MKKPHIIMAVVPRKSCIYFAATYTIICRSWKRASPKSNLWQGSMFASFALPCLARWVGANLVTSTHSCRHSLTASHNVYDSSYNIKMQVIKLCNTITEQDSWEENYGKFQHILIFRVITFINVYVFPTSLIYLCYILLFV